jgi:hypothetical protein
MFYLISINQKQPGEREEKRSDCMVWIQYKEKYHGKTTKMWKNKKTIASARKECKDWNQFNNPHEHLSVVKHSKTKPKGIRKTAYRGIYK